MIKWMFVFKLIAFVLLCHILMDFEFAFQPEKMYKVASISARLIGSFFPLIKNG